MRKRILSLISSGKTAKAVQTLLKYSQNLKDEEESKSIVLLASRFKYLMRQDSKRLITEEEKIKELAKINSDIIFFLDNSTHLSKTQTKENGLETFLKSYNENSEKASWQKRVLVIILIALLLGSGTILRNHILSPLQLTIYVHGNRGLQDYSSELAGEIVLDMRNDRRVANIGENGRTNFGEISRDFLGENIFISTKIPGFSSEKPDSTYRYDGSPIYLKVIPSIERRILKGNVFNQNATTPIPGVRVETKNISSFTDSLGFFELRIPINEVEDKYKLSLSKSGYEPDWEFYYPLLGNHEFRLDSLKN